MPVMYSPDMGGPIFYTRQQLRWRLGRDFVHDTYIGQISAGGSLGALQASVYFLDVNLADVSMSGETKYSRSWARYRGQSYRCASFNFASGAFITGQTQASFGVTPDVVWELHELISPEEKDHAITFALEHTWKRQEVALNTVDGATFYSVGNDIGQVFDWWVYATPDGSGNREKRVFRGQRPEIRLTGSATRELRIDGALQASMQIVLDAAVKFLPLSISEDTSIGFSSPAELQTVLYAAESQCWETLAKRSAAQDSRVYLRNAQRAAAAYSRLSGRFAPQRDYAPRFRNSVPARAYDGF